MKSFPDAITEATERELARQAAVYDRWARWSQLVETWPKQNSIVFRIVSGDADA